MKIAITGHTEKFGEILNNILIAHGHTTAGYSRTTGFDLNTVEGRKYALSSMIRDNTECLIMNTRIGLVELLETFIGRAETIGVGSIKTIITLGSRAPDAGIFTKSHEYAAEKAKLDFLARHAVMALHEKCGVRVIHLRPSYLSGSGHDNQPCIKSEDVAELINDLLTKPHLSTVLEISLSNLGDQ